MKKKGFIFDLDGVIVDTAKYHFLAWKALATSLDFDFTETQNEELKGVSRVKSLEKILSWAKQSISQEKFQELMHNKNVAYLRYIDKMTQEEILPDVPKILNALIKRGQPIALGSASKNARTILDKVKLLSKFDAIVDGNNVIHGKPHPEVFLSAASELKLAPEDCVVFEDSIAGIQAANKANMISIGIGDEEVLHEADYIFKDFTEIAIDFIEQIMNESLSKVK